MSILLICKIASGIYLYIDVYRSTGNLGLIPKKNADDRSAQLHPDVTFIVVVSLKLEFVISTLTHARALTRVRVATTVKFATNVNMTGSTVGLSGWLVSQRTDNVRISCVVSKAFGPGWLRDS